MLVCFRGGFAPDEDRKTATTIMAELVRPEATRLLEFFPKDGEGADDAIGTPGLQPAACFSASSWMNSMSVIFLIRVLPQ